jgi:hypothetical protein
VLVWRLDRLSRNLGDLILLADTFGKNDVGQHSFTEKIDLSSPWLQPVLSVRKRVGAGRPVGLRQLAQDEEVWEASGANGKVPPARPPDRRAGDRPPPG